MHSTSQLRFEAPNVENIFYKPRKKPIKDVQVLNNRNERKLIKFCWAYPHALRFSALLCDLIHQLVNEFLARARRLKKVSPVL